MGIESVSLMCGSETFGAVLSENPIRWRFSHATFPAMREIFPVSSKKFPVQVRREFWRKWLTYRRKTEPSSRPSPLDLRNSLYFPA